MSAKLHPTGIIIVFAVLELILLLNLKEYICEVTFGYYLLYVFTLFYLVIIAILWKTPVQKTKFPNKFITWIIFAKISILTYFLISALYIEHQFHYLISQIEDYKAREGNYPKSLDEITDGNKNLLKIGEYHISKSSFSLMIYIINPAISHYYDSRNGYGHSDD